MTDLWITIKNNLSKNPRDIKTVPKNKRKPKWFYAYTENDDVIITNAQAHIESCSIKGNRKLDKQNASILYDCYLKRKANIRENHYDITRNGSYWFGIFADLEF